VHLNDDPAAKTQVLQYFQEFLGPIDAHGDVIRISDSELLEFDDPDLSLREIGESISADVFVRIVNDRPQAAGLITSWPRDNWPEANRALSVEIGIPVRGRFGFGWRVERVKANSTRWDAAVDPQAQIDSQIYSIFQEAYAYIRPDLRVPGFTESLRPPGFGPGQRPGRMTEEDVRMLLDQARLAGNPAERTDVWVRLRGSEHAAIVVPALTEAALYDPVAGVRMAAVDSLMGYPETAGVRETLQAISAGEAPAALRERAAMYLRTPAEHGDYTVERLLDESLTDAERLAPLLAISLADYGDGSYRSSQYSEDVWLPNTSAVSTALVELAARTEDVRARIILIERMVFAEGSEVVDQLLEFLASDPSDDVREAAADSLAPHVDQERVRVALERAGREDP
jgi:hypothetical protein